MTTEYPEVTDWGRIPPERRGRWGRFLYAQRWMHGRMTQTSARALLAAAGHPLSPAYYSEFEGGGALPNEEWQGIFTRLWGDEPRPEPSQEKAATASADMAVLVARLERQAEVIDRLAAAVEVLAQGQDALVRAFAGGLVELRSEPEADPASASHAGTRQ